MSYRTHTLPVDIEIYQYMPSETNVRTIYTKLIIAIITFTDNLIN